MILERFHVQCSVGFFMVNESGCEKHWRIYCSKTERIQHEIMVELIFTKKKKNIIHDHGIFPFMNLKIFKKKLILNH